MTKKKLNLKVAFDAPVTIFFAVLSVVLFLFEAVLLKNKLPGGFLASPTVVEGELPFIASSPSSYLRLIAYSFGAENWAALLTNMMFVLLLGPAMEERYGSVVIGIMMMVSAIFAGVLNACFCSVSLRGCTSIVFMMIFLNSFMSFSKKKIPFSFVLIFIVYIAREIMEKGFSNIVGIVICVAGGLCGSLFAFLTSPKAKVTRKAEAAANAEKKQADSLSDSDKTAYLEELDSQSPRNLKKNKKDKKNDGDDETTVVGTLKF